MHLLLIYRQVSYPVSYWPNLNWRFLQFFKGRLFAKSTNHSFLNVSWIIVAGPKQQPRNHLIIQNLYLSSANVATPANWKKQEKKKQASGEISLKLYFTASGTFHNTFQVKCPASGNMVSSVSCLKTESGNVKLWLCIVAVWKLNV